MEIKNFVESAVKRELTQEQIAWFFDQPEPIIKETLEHLSLKRDWGGFDKSFEEAILALSNPEKVFLMYVQWYICTVDFDTRPWRIKDLSKKAQSRLLEIPDAADVIKSYAAHHEFCDEVIVKLFDNFENFKAYIYHRRLSEVGFYKMMELKPELRDKLLYQYLISYHLREPQELLMIKKLSLDSKVLDYYNEKYGFCSKVRGYMELALMRTFSALAQQVNALDVWHRPLGPTTLDQA